MWTLVLCPPRGLGMAGAAQRVGQTLGIVYVGSIPSKARRALLYCTRRCSCCPVTGGLHVDACQRRLAGGILAAPCGAVLAGCDPATTLGSICGAGDPHAACERRPVCARVDPACIVACGELCLPGFTGG